MAKVKLEDIRIDGGTQPRKDINEEIVSEYAEAMQDGDKFPPVVVFQDGANYWLADGFHRYHASKKVGYLEIEAETKQGTRRDAVLHSVGANSDHGLRRSNEDKRKAVLTLLNDEEWSGWSDSEIARRCAVHQTFVSKLHRGLDASHNSKLSENKERTYTDKHGNTSKMDTSNIGNSQKEFTEAKNETFDRHEKSFEKLGNTDVDPETGEMLGVEKEIERKGIGLQKAHEAIAKLKEIPPNDGLIDDAYDTVIQWINHNR